MLSATVLKVELTSILFILSTPSKAARVSGQRNVHARARCLANLVAPFRSELPLLMGGAGSGVAGSG